MLREKAGARGGWRSFDDVVPRLADAPLDDRELAKAGCDEWPEVVCGIDSCTDTFDSVAQRGAHRRHRHCGQGA